MHSKHLVARYQRQHHTVLLYSQTIRGNQLCVVGVISVPGPYPDSAGASVSVGISVAGMGAGAGAPPLDTYIAAAIMTQAK